MEFDKSKVFTALDADELRPGSKVICANSLSDLKEYVKEGEAINTLKRVDDIVKHKKKQERCNLLLQAFVMWMMLYSLVMNGLMTKNSETGGRR